MAKFSDIQLIQFLQKAARRVNRRLCLTNTPDEITVDGAGVVTNPDNNDIEDIVLLQTECLILQRSVNDDLDDGNAGTLVRDGEQTVDTTALSRLRESLLNSNHNACEEVKFAIIDFKLNNQGNKLVW